MNHLQCSKHFCLTIIVLIESNSNQPIFTFNHLIIVLALFPLLFTGGGAETCNMGSVDIPTRSVATTRTRSHRTSGTSASRSLGAQTRVRVRFLYAKAARARRLGWILLGRAQVWTLLYDAIFYFYYFN